LLSLTEPSVDADLAVDIDDGIRERGAGGTIGAHGLAKLDAIEQTGERIVFHLELASDRTVMYPI
jgi:hypothetical protein